MSNLDILTLAEALDVLSRGAAKVTDEDAVAIATIVTAASSRLDELIGCSVVRTVTGEAHTARGRMVTLKRWPVAELVSVVEAGVELGDSDVFLDAAWGGLHRVSGGADVCWSSNRGGVVVSYRAGRAESTIDVDPRVKAAAQIVVRHMWEQGQTLGAAMLDQAMPSSTPRSFSVPKRALDLVRDLVRPSFF